MNDTSKKNVRQMRRISLTERDLDDLLAIHGTHSASQLAKQTGERLHFLFVVNLDFLMMTEKSRTQVLSEEMRGLGEFILLTAQAKADKSGVIAEGSVRQGNVMEEIVTLAKELEVSHIVLGRPRLEDQPSLGQ